MIPSSHLEREENRERFRKRGMSSKNIAQPIFPTSFLEREENQESFPLKSAGCLSKL